MYIRANTVTNELSEFLKSQFICTLNIENKYKYMKNKQLAKISVLFFKYLSPQIYLKKGFSTQNVSMNVTFEMKQFDSKYFEDIEIACVASSIIH